VLAVRATGAFADPTDRAHLAAGRRFTVVDAPLVREAEWA
jgi:CRISPR/Cas system CMR subunit Cmr4 (Cas7 group RAMP superfamily)